MSESGNLEEWFQKRIDVNNDSRIRCDAYSKSQSDNVKWIYSWLSSIFGELWLAYHVLKDFNKDLEQLLDVSRDLSELKKIANPEDKKTFEEMEKKIERITKYEPTLIELSKVIEDTKKKPRKRNQEEEKTKKSGMYV